MSVRFILGRAGTGKTYYCLNAIREELKRSQAGPPLLFLVPDQATFEMSRALLRDGDLPGYARAHVLSFRRLAYHVFNEVGGPTLPPAGHLARQLVIARVLEQNKSKLTVFGPSARRPASARRDQGCREQAAGALKAGSAERVGRRHAGRQHPHHL